MVIASLLGVPLEDQNQRARAHRPGLPHRAGRRHDQRRQLRRHVGAARPTSARSSRPASPRPATTCSPTSCRPRSPTTTARRAASPIEESADFANLADQRGHRDGRPPARLGGGRARRAPRPAGRAGRRPGAHPERGRGAAALRGAVAGAGPLDHRRGRACTATTIPASSKVLLLTGSAGRDERKYPDADRFDIHRSLRPPRVVRLRHPLLPRRGAGPHGGPHRPRGDADPLPRVARRPRRTPCACTPAPCAAG